MRLIVLSAIMLSLLLPCAWMPVILLIFLYPISSSSLTYFGPHQHNSQQPPYPPFVSPLSLLSALPAKVSKKWWKFHDRNLGHSDSTLSEGLKEDDDRNDDNNEPRNSKPPKNHTLESYAIEEGGEIEEDDDVEDEANHLIKVDEMREALTTAQSLVNQSTSEIVALGWKVVHEGKQFGLFKRRQKRLNGEDGAVEYLMMGHFQDISPFTFLLSQIDRQWRQIWDKTMKEMSLGNISLSHTHNYQNQSHIGSSVQQGHDMLYYRTKWPWPLKDRDYTLARRVKIFEDENAIMLVSRSAEDKSVPVVDGVIRVDNYWCNAVVFSYPTTKTTTSEQSSDKMEAVSGSPIDEEAVEGGGEEVQATSSTLHQYFFHNPLLRRRHPPNTHIINYRLLRRMQRFQQRYQSELRTLKRTVVIPYHTRDHIKWRLKQDMIQRQIDAIRGWKAVVNHKIVAEKEPLQQSINSLDIDNADSINNYDSNGDPENNGNSQDTQPPAVTASIKRNFRHRNTLNRHGLRFVTIFCDDSRVPLHPRIVDALSSMGEKLVPDSITNMHQVALQLEKKFASDRNNNLQSPQQESQQIGADNDVMKREMDSAAAVVAKFNR